MPRKPKSTPQATGHVGTAAKRNAASKPKASPKPPTKAKAGAKPNAKAKKAIKQKPVPAVILAARKGLAAETVTERTSPKMGRPTKYDPAYCDLVVEWGRQGKSGEWIACEIGVIYETMLNWSKQYPDFFDALTLAKQLELRWWEDAGQTNMLMTGFSASAWSRSMAARFPSKWTEKQQRIHDATGSFLGLLSEISGRTAALIG